MLLVSNHTVARVVGHFFYVFIEPISASVKTDVEIETYVRGKIDEMGDEAEELVCSETKTINRKDQKNASNGK